MSSAIPSGPAQSPGKRRILWPFEVRPRTLTTCTKLSPGTELSTGDAADAGESESRRNAGDSDVARKQHSACLPETMGHSTMRIPKCNMCAPSGRPLVRRCSPRVAPAMVGSPQPLQLLLALAGCGCGCDLRAWLPYSILSIRVSSCSTRRPMRVVQPPRTARHAPTSPCGGRVCGGP